MSKRLRSLALDDLVLAGGIDGADWVLSAEVQRGNKCYGFAVDGRAGAAGSGSCFGSTPMSGSVHFFAGQSGSWNAIHGIASRQAVEVRGEGGSGSATAVLSEFLDEYGWRQWTLFVRDDERPDRVVAIDAAGDVVGTYRPSWGR